MNHQIKRELTKEEILAAEVPEGTPGALYVFVRRAFARRGSLVLVSPSKFPPDAQLPVMAALGGFWAIEVGELDSMSRAEVTKVKAFASSQKHLFRVSRQVALPSRSAAECASVPQLPASLAACLAPVAWVVDRRRLNSSLTAVRSARSPVRAALAAWMKRWL